MPYLRIVTNTRDADIAQETPTTMAKCIEALTKPLTTEEQFAGNFPLPPEPRILATGTYEEIQTAFLGDPCRYSIIINPSQYTDGSPVGLPTEEAVNAMLAGTSHSRDELVGQIRPGLRNATVEKVAINAVMAGCKPSYMPVLLALTEAMVNTDTGEALLGAQGWFSFGAVVGGPIAKEIELNAGEPNLSGAAPLTPGVPTNTTIGRFIRLMMVNIGMIEPGVNEAKGIGNPHKTSIVLAEADNDSPWPQMATEINDVPGAQLPPGGFQDTENTVTFFVFWGDMLNGFRAQYTGDTVLGTASEPTIRGKLGGVAEAAKFLSRSQQGLVLMMSPADAQALAKAGYSRTDVKKWISEHSVDRYTKAKQMGLGSGVVGTVFKIQGAPLNPSGAWPPEWKTPGYDEIVKYYPMPWHVTILVGIGSYNGAILNGTPRWTVKIDKWK